MDKGLAVVLTAVVGGLIALQAPINAGLARYTGSIGAATVSFLVGTMLLAAVLVVSGRAGELSGTGEASWYYLFGGVLGAAYVFAVILTVSVIGAGGVAAATITGQLLASVALDRIGAFGLDQVSLGPDRIVGVALLLAGTYLVVR
ncbi:MAG: DMT family transporter [Solirubrobacterales bacterium]